MRHMTPRDIETESMSIIEREAGTHRFPDEQWQIVRRIIHATADFDFLGSIRCHPQAVPAGVGALRAGCPIYTDTEMLAAAVHNSIPEGRGCRVVCCVSDEDIKRQSRETGVTRSRLALRKAAPLLTRGIVAIGNAPTALREALALFEQHALVPSLVIGLPVGFVDAQEAKEALRRSACVFITNADRKGGTPAAAAVINALTKIAEGT